MAIKLKSVLKIQKQQLLLLIRAVLFATSLWLLADQDFSALQLLAFVIIGAVLYFIPVFQTLLVLPSFFVLMTISPIALSVFGPQVSYPSLLAAFFGLLFYILLGIKQFVFVARIKLHQALHLALLYCVSILFFAAPGGDWFVTRSLLLAFFAYFLIREFFLIRGFAKDAQMKLTSALIAFVLVEFVWAINLLPIGFINAAGVLLVLLFTLEELLVFALRDTLTRRELVLELSTCFTLIATIFAFSNWTLP